MGWITWILGTAVQQTYQLTGVQQPPACFASEKARNIFNFTLGFTAEVEYNASLICAAAFLAVLVPHKLP